MGSMTFFTDKKTIERGDIFYVESSYNESGSEQRGGRPGIIISNDVGNKNAPIVSVVYLTTSPKNNQPTHTAVNSTGRASIAMCEQIYTISKSRLGDYCGTCTEDEMARISKCIRIALGLSETQTPQEVEAPVIKNDENELLVLRTQLNTYKDLYHQMVERVMRG